MRRIYIFILAMLFLTSCEKNSTENRPTLKLYGDALEDIGYSISMTENGYYLGGQITEVIRNKANYIETDSSVSRMAVIKTDRNGNRIWEHSFGENAAVGTKVLALQDGSVISTGYVLDAVNQKDIYVVKVSADGLSFSEKIYTEYGNQYGIDILQTTEGFMILGSTDKAREGTADSIGNASGKSDIYLLRIDNNLEPLSAVANGWPGNDQAVAIKNDINGGYVITGTTDNSWPNQDFSNIFILKTNLYGEPTMIRIIGTPDYEYASDLEVLDDGYLIAGIVGREGSDQWVYLSRIPDDIFSNTVITTKFKVSSAYSTASSFAVRAISRYSTDSFVMAGQAGTGTSAKMLIFVTDAEGKQVPGKEMISSATGVQVAYDVISDETDEIIAIGKNSFENNSMISLFKIRF
ncbi:MAG: hypothetical protein QG611_170 [Bacteroidota bacterium]|nr:hypothetical protein [Bacteroidota bacterium]